MQYSAVCCYSFMDKFTQETCPVKFGGRKRGQKNEETVKKRYYYEHTTVSLHDMRAKRGEQTHCMNIRPKWVVEYVLKHKI